MSLSFLFVLTFGPFLSAWLLAEGVRQFAYARKLSRRRRAESH